MNEILKFVGSWGLALFVFPPFITFILQASALHSLGKEVDKNEKFDIPEQHQVYWHIVHNREDVKAIYYMVLYGFVIVIAFLWLIANKLHVFD
jgi:hypothetical protein